MFLEGIDMETKKLLKHIYGRNNAKPPKKANNPGKRHNKLNEDITNTKTTKLALLNIKSLL